MKASISSKITTVSNTSSSPSVEPRKTRAELKKELKNSIKAKTTGLQKSATPEVVSKKGSTKESIQATSSKFPKELIPQILREDKYFLIINKPAGLVVHPDGKTIEPTLCDWIVQNYPKIVGVGEPSKGPNGVLLDRPGIVHRLDRETSGVLVIAKTQESFEFLKKSFQTRDVQKTYNTFVWGLVKEDKGSIDRPIGRSKTDFKKWSAERFARGDLRPATTEYKVLLRKSFVEGEEKGGGEETVKLSSKDSKNSKIPLNFTFVEAYPKTGRTHQIRVHFKAINHPVVGDALYAPNHPQMLGFKRLALHSRHISFTSLDGKRVEVEASLPEDFQSALKFLSN
jgi:23S rRNA pseudouridine1911/1915/1917 synthase